MRRVLPMLLVLVCGAVAAALLYRLIQMPVGDGSQSLTVRPHRPEKTESAPQVGGTVDFVSGAVEFRPADGEWKRASIGQGLQAGDAVEVVGDGRAAIRFADGNSVRLDRDTLAEISQLEDSSVTVAAVKGRVYAYAGSARQSLRLTTGVQEYQGDGDGIHTYLATVGEENSVAVFEGNVAVKDVLGAEQTAFVEAGNQLQVVISAENGPSGKTQKLDPKSLNKDEFVKWNLEWDKEISAADSVTQQKEAPGTATELAEKNSSASGRGLFADSGNAPLTITLSGKPTADGVYLAWTVQGTSPPNGFKLLKSREAYPVYPGSDFVYLTNGDDRDYVWPLLDGETYHIRACAYLGDGTCGNYSNDVSVTAPKKTVSAAPKTETAADSGVKRLALSSAGGRLVRWTVEGQSPSGFKVVWSKSPGPTYPTRDADQYLYFADPLRRTAEINAFNGAGKYYVRVCEYLGGTCGLYSNEIIVDLGD
ncbi:MAG: FecR domain-containing protein [Patescibacteria group bacterium]|nr:FecR domain-containing protein [Patescibacteria group bacterium]